MTLSLYTFFTLSYLSLYSLNCLSLAACKRWLIKLIHRSLLVYISPARERERERVEALRHFPSLCAGNCSTLSLSPSPFYCRSLSLSASFTKLCSAACDSSCLRSQHLWGRVHSAFGSKIHLAAELARVKSSDAADGNSSSLARDRDCSALPCLVWSGLPSYPVI